MRPTRFSLAQAPTSLLCLMLALPVADALAQGRVSNKTLDQRLQRVERVLDQSLLEMLQQIESLEQEVRVLNGKLEEQAHRIESLQQRNRDLYLDTDSRLSGVEDQIEQLQTVTVPVDGEPAEDADPDSAASGPPTDAGDDPVETQPPADDVGQATEQEKQQYRAAHDLLASGRNRESVTAFKAFLETYPDGPFSDNAWYWMGEALYARRDFDGALSRFQHVVDTFPDSPKVPDARLKIGYALYEQQRYQEARRVLMAVSEHYPGRSAAVLAEKRLRDMQSQGH